jgi:hypothetical protein
MECACYRKIVDGTWNVPATIKSQGAPFSPTAPDVQLENDVIGF